MPSAWGELKKLPEVFLLVTPKVRTKTPVWYSFGFVNSLFFVNCLELSPVVHDLSCKPQVSVLIRGRPFIPPLDNPYKG